MSVTVYHGGTETVKSPICRFGRKGLDFGSGFYVTDRLEQATGWAKATAGRRNALPLLNVYRLDRDAFLREGNCKIFPAYDAEWLEFIVANRRGLDVASGFDYVEGGVADDRVVDTVNLYMAGLMSVDVALGRLSQHKPNNQICLLNQALTDKYLVYEGTESLG